jgi:hypothetical protein
MKSTSLFQSTSLAVCLCIFSSASTFAAEGEIVDNVPLIMLSQDGIGEARGGSPRSPSANAVYSNYTNTTGGTVMVGGIVTATNTRVTKLLADDLQCTAGGVPMVQYNFTIYNANTTAFTATPLFRFYADNANKPGTFLGGFNGAATSFPATTIGTYGALVSPTWTIPANGKMWVGTAFLTTTGTAAQRNNFGVALYDPPDVGTSLFPAPPGSEDYLSTALGANNANAFSANSPAGTVTSGSYPGGPRNHAYEIIIGSGVCCISSPSPSCSIMTQPACIAAGGTYLGNNTTCSGLDCNNNGKDDVCDIASGFSQDCNHNGIPDSCDIASNFSQDVDANGVPDSCQPDCNNNGVLDGCEVPGGCALGNCGAAYPALCGTAQDCQGNGTLDSCELGPWTVYNAGTCTADTNAGGPDGAGGWDTNGFLDKFQVLASGQGLFKSYHTEVAYQGGVVHMTNLRLRIYRLPTGSIPADLPSFATAVPIYDHTYTAASGELVFSNRSSCFFGFPTENYDATGPAFTLSPPGFYAVFVNFPGFTSTNGVLVATTDDGFGNVYQWGANNNTPAIIASFPLAWNLKLASDDTNANTIPDECEAPRACCFSDGHCELLTQAACTGTWGAYGSTCTPNNCPLPQGSCCQTNGSCTVTSQAACIGTWTLNGTCTPNTCPQPTGSCCHTDGTCAVTLQADCTGTWTMFGTCTPNTCPQPTGSCCQLDGSCAVTLEADCTGTWTMFATCTPNLCPQPTGSCCHTDGTCAVTLQVDCVGTWTMFGICDPNTCAQPTGSCCHTDGTCNETLEVDCTGTWTTFGTCTPNTCQQPTGSCCHADGTCAVTLEADCIGTWTIFGTCTPNTCPQPSGSCCQTDGTCDESLEADCKGTWTMFGTCTPNTCKQPTGSCCHTDGTCAVTLEKDCTGTWTIFGTCTPNTCPQPTGSCCHADGTCDVTLQTACTGTWTMFATCTPNTCRQPSGSCCHADGTCAEELAANCIGTWTIFGLCTPNPCPCPLMGDINADDVVNGLDVQGFVDCALGGLANCRCGDFDDSGEVDSDDISGFISALLP